MTFFNIRTEVRGSCPRGEAHVGRGKPRQRWALGGSAAPGASPTRRRSAATAGPEAMPPRRSPRLVEDLKSSRAASQGNSRPANSSARAPKHDHPLGPIAKGSLILPKIESKIGRPPSCWNLEHACPCPESDFFSTPPQPRNSATAVECAAEMEAPLWRVASRRVNTSACSITRSTTDPLCRKESLETLESFRVVKIAAVSTHNI